MLLYYLFALIPELTESKVAANTRSKTTRGNSLCLAKATPPCFVGEGNLHSPLFLFSPALRRVGGQSHQHLKPKRKVIYRKRNQEKVAPIIQKYGRVFFIHLSLSLSSGLIPGWCLRETDTKKLRKDSEN